MTQLIIFSLVGWLVHNFKKFSIAKRKLADKFSWSFYLQDHAVDMITSGIVAIVAAYTLPDIIEYVPAWGLRVDNLSAFLVGFSSSSIARDLLKGKNIGKA